MHRKTRKGEKRATQQQRLQAAGACTGSQGDEKLLAPAHAAVETRRRRAQPMMSFPLCGRPPPAGRNRPKPPHRLSRYRVEGQP